MSATSYYQFDSGSLGRMARTQWMNYRFQDVCPSGLEDETLYHHVELDYHELVERLLRGFSILEQPSNKCRRGGVTKRNFICFSSTVVITQMASSVGHFKWTK